MKKMQIANAERRRAGPVDDSNLVDEMFGFIDAEGPGGEGAAPSAFRVSKLVVVLVECPAGRCGLALSRQSAYDWDNFCTREFL